MAKEIQNRNVTFRRIRGRIVPIKMKVSDSEIKTAKAVAGGTLIAGAGVGISLVSGNTYRKALFSSTKAGLDAFGKVAKRFEPRQPTFMQNAKRLRDADHVARSLKFASRMSTGASLLKSISPYVGAALIGGGAFYALNALPRKNKKQIDPNLAAGAGAALSAIVPKALQVSRDAFEAGFGGKQATMQFASSRFKNTLPAIKDLTLKIIRAKIT